MEAFTVLVPKGDGGKLRPLTVLSQVHRVWACRACKWRGGVNRAPQIWGMGLGKGSTIRHHSYMEKRHRLVSCSCLPAMGNPKNAGVM